MKSKSTNYTHTYSGEQSMCLYRDTGVIWYIHLYRGNMVYLLMGRGWFSANFVISWGLTSKYIVRTCLFVCLFVCLSLCLSVCPSRFWKITIKPKIIKVEWKEPIIWGVCPEIYSILPLLGRAPGGGIFLVYVTILYVTKCMSRFWKINIKQKLL